MELKRYEVDIGMFVFGRGHVGGVEIKLPSPSFCCAEVYISTLIRVNPPVSNICIRG